jgi:luciferase family oxidoreductase group 1
MLSHYSSLKVAECFRMLETLFPGRIDLGIGRAPGSDQLTARALQPGGGLGLDRFPEQIADLVGYLGDCLPANHPFARVRAMPAGPTAPEVWLLGSSDQSALYAAHFGLGFSFAHFINADGGAEVTRAYRDRFRPSAAFPEPRASVGVFALCADTEAEARRLAQSRDLFIVRSTRADGALPIRRGSRGLSLQPPRAGDRAQCPGPVGGRHPFAGERAPERPRRRVRRGRARRRRHHP